jgi:hypothetical protein
MISLPDLVTGPSGSGSMLISNQQPTRGPEGRLLIDESWAFPGDLVSAHPEKSCPLTRTHLSAYPDLPVSADRVFDRHRDLR